MGREASTSTFPGQALFGNPNLYCMLPISPLCLDISQDLRLSPDTHYPPEPTPLISPGQSMAYLINPAAHVKLMGFSLTGLSWTPDI